MAWGLSMSEPKKQLSLTQFFRDVCDPGVCLTELSRCNSPEAGMEAPLGDEAADWVCQNIVRE
jgi:hypothetical protein